MTTVLFGLESCHLDIEIEGELARMGPQLHVLDLVLPLEADVVLDHVGRKYIVPDKKLMVSL
jgi:hypothetical protein